LGATLGKGSVAFVRRATCLADGTEVAVKCVQSSDDEMRKFARDEYDLVRGLRHRGIVHMIDLHESPFCLWMCMELCSDGSVESYIKKSGCFNENVARGLFVQVLKAVDHLHRKRIVHRDLKPDNLLLDGGARVIKIADFNSAKQIGSASCSCMLSNRGTRSFSAPELYFGQLWNERVDIWASGLCFYFMLCGKLPFDIQKSRVKKAILVCGQLPPVKWEGVSDMQQNLIVQCLAINMRDRPPAMELLKHRGLNEADSTQHRRARWFYEPTSEMVPEPDTKKDGPVAVLPSLFVLLPLCGLVSVYPLQQQLRLDSGNAKDLLMPCVDDWFERRDSAPLLNKLANSRFECALAKQVSAPPNMEGKGNIDIPAESSNESRSADPERKEPMEAQQEFRLARRNGRASKLGQTKFFTRSVVNSKFNTNEGDA